MKKFVLAALGCVAVIAVSGLAQAGTLSFTTFTTDVGTGISPTSTFTHHVDLNGNSAQGATTINGVSFDVSGSGNNPSLNYNITTSNAFQNNNDGGTAGAPGAHNLLLNFNYGPTNLTLSGLQPNTSYVSRFFVSTTFGGVGYNFTANDPGGAVGDSSLPIAGVFPGTVAQNQAATTFLDRSSGNANAAGEYIYRYTTGAAQSSMVFTFTASDGQNGFHSYGFSNELAVPEPAALILLGLGGLGLLALLRRQV